jgi:hypothetical protein
VRLASNADFPIKETLSKAGSEGFDTCRKKPGYTATVTRLGEHPAIETPRPPSNFRVPSTTSVSFADSLHAARQNLAMQLVPFLRYLETL